MNFLNDEEFISFWLWLEDEFIAMSHNLTITDFGFNEIKII